MGDFLADFDFAELISASNHNRQNSDCAYPLVICGIHSLVLPRIRLRHLQLKHHTGASRLHATLNADSRIPLDFFPTVKLTTHPFKMGRIIRPANLLGQYLRPNVSTHKVGVVVSAGKMSKAVKVRIAAQEWNNHIRKVSLLFNLGLFEIVWKKKLTILCLSTFPPPKPTS